MSRTPSNSQYISQTSPSLNPAIKKFFEDFYLASDTGTEEGHEIYARDYFTRKAVLVMGLKRGVGREEILAIRKGMWTAVEKRSHKPVKIYGFEGNGHGEGKEEVMIHGTVGYVFKDGREVEVEWAARAELEKEDGKWKMRLYQVYLDSAAMQNAK